MRGAWAADWRVACLVLPFVLLALSLTWLRYLPNLQGGIAADYSVWLPDLLAGYFAHVQGGYGSAAWFNPADCGGVPLQADPQGAFFSLPQFLTFVMPPLRAVEISYICFAALGFLGCFTLARLCFQLSRVAALVASVLFAFNDFYSVRVVVGHLSFMPFMLLPALAACLLAGSCNERGAVADWVLRCGCFGLLFATMIEGGMLVLLPPIFLSLLILLAMHAIATESDLAPSLYRLSIGMIVGIALGSGKLAAVLSLMANVPRDSYPLPGFGSVWETVWVTLRAVFSGPSTDMSNHLLNSVLRFERHEFDYSVGPVPLVLLVAAAAVTWRRWRVITPRERLTWDALVFLLLIPIALNTCAAFWTSFLKILPIIRNSSSLLRWLAAYILPAVIGAGLALDKLVALRLVRIGSAAWVSVAASVAMLVFTDHRFYGADGIGTYNPQAIEQSWHDVRATGHVPVITDIAVARDSHGQVSRNVLARQDGMVRGQSQLFCYDPLFGYFLEFFPQGALHPGSIFERTGGLNPAESRLNLKNPACYVFPTANGCKPGDAFKASEIREATDFAAYRPFDWKKPVWAHLADWLSLLAWPATLLAVVAALCRRLRGRRSSTLAA